MVPVQCPLIMIGAMSSERIPSASYVARSGMGNSATLIRAGLPADRLATTVGNWS